MIRRALLLFGGLVLYVALGFALFVWGPSPRCRLPDDSAPCRFSTDGKHVVTHTSKVERDGANMSWTHGGPLKVWDLRSGAYVSTIVGEDEKTEHDVFWFERVTLSRDNKWISIGFKDKLRICEFPSGNLHFELPGRTTSAFAPDSAKIAVQSDLEPAKVAIWSIVTKEVQHSVSINGRLQSWTPDGLQFAVLFNETPESEATELHLCAVSDGAIKARYTVPKNWSISQIHHSPDGQTVSADCSVKFEGGDTSNPSAVLWNVKKGGAPISKAIGHAFPRYTRDGKTVLLDNLNDHRLVDTATGKIERLPLRAPFGSCAPVNGFQSDLMVEGLTEEGEKGIIVRFLEYLRRRDPRDVERLGIYDLKRREKVAPIPVTRNQHSMTVYLTPDDTLLAVLRVENTGPLMLEIWDIPPDEKIPLRCVLFGLLTLAYGTGTVLLLRKAGKINQVKTEPVPG